MTTSRILPFLDRYPRKEQQQLTGGFYALPLRLDGTTSTHYDFGTLEGSGGNEEQRLLLITVRPKTPIGRTNTLFRFLDALPLRPKCTATSRSDFNRPILQIRSSCSESSVHMSVRSLYLAGATTGPSCSPSMDRSVPEHRQQHQRVCIFPIGLTGLQ